MSWQYTPLIIPLIIAAGMAAGLALYSWRHRSAVGATPFAVLMLAVAEWSLVYGLRLSCTDLDAKIFWAKVRYLGIVVAPTAWLIFVLEYTNQERWLTRRTIAALTIEPLIILALTWTNEAHHLIWSETDLIQSGSLIVWRAGHGVMYWTHAMYTYLLLLLSLFLLGQAFVRSPRLYRGQAGILLFSVLIPIVGDILATWDLISIPLDLTPFSFTIAGLTAAWGIFFFRLFDIVPMARNAVVDSMSEGMFVLDEQDRVIDINPAAEEIVGRPAWEIVGRSLIQLLPDWRELLERHDGVTEAHGEITVEGMEKQHSYELCISPLYDHSGQARGRLIIVHDITQRKQVEAALQAQKQLFENLVAMARATAKRTSLEHTLQSALNMAAALTGADHGSMFLLDGTGAVTHSVLARGDVSPEKRRHLVGRVMKDGLAGWVVRHQRPALIADTSRDERWLELPDMPYQVRSALAMPIVSGSAVLGVLTLTHSQPNHFTTEHAYMIQSSADQMTLAVRNAQMYDEQRLLADRQTTLYEALRTVGQHLDPQTIARAAVGAIARLTGWPAVAIALPNDAATHLIVRAGAGALSIEADRRIPVDRGVIGRAFRTAETQYVPDVSADCDLVGDDQVVCCELVVPLRRGQRVLGVLDVASDRPSAFNDEDVLLAKSLAEAIALALDNARLYAETRQYADAIAQERSRLQALIESSRDGIILVGTDRRLLVINAPAVELLQLAGQAEDWVNRPWRDALNALKPRVPRVVRDMWDEMRRVQSGDERPGVGEWEIPPRTVRWLNLPVTADTVPLGRLLVLRDVTEERMLEKMRDDLIHTMVHDLRNPLTAISGVLSFLEEPVLQALPSNQHELWEIARTSTQNMLDMVRAILEISRLESRQMPLDHTMISLPNLVADVLDSQLPLAVDKDLHLENDVPSTLPPAWADERMIERVLKNLVGNAIKFTPAGGTVRVAGKRDDTSRILVSVSDTGRGIPPQIQERLFQKFVTGEQEERGSGLGLAFCKMVIEAHGESIWVEETSERGTTFAFTLPLPPALES